MRFKAVFLSLITVVVGCNRDKAVYVQEDEPYELQFSMGTKAGSTSDVTYRTVLYQYNDLSECCASRVIFCICSSYSPLMRSICSLRNIWSSSIIFSL